MHYYDITMHNLDLRFDLEKIARYEPPITVAKAYEPQFESEDESGCPYAIDIESGSYWYANEQERNEDYDKLMMLFPQFYFVN